MSNFLNFAGNSGVTFKNHGTGGGTSFTLDKAASTNSVLLSIGGIIQKPSTDYSVSGTTITTTSSVTSGVEVFSLIIHDAGNAPVIEDNSIVTAKIADNQVTGAKIAMGSDAAGDILYYNGTDYVRLAKGSALQQLRINSGATAPEWATIASGGFSFIDSTNVTAVSDISFTDLADGYDYLIQLENVDVASDSQGIYFQLGVAGPTYRTSGYLMSVAGIRGTGTYHNQETNFGVMLATGEGTGSNEHLYFSQTMLLNPANAATKTTTFGQNIYYNYQPLNCGEFTGGRYDTAEANTCIKIYPGSGNFSSGGTIRRYRRARS